MRDKGALDERIAAILGIEGRNGTLRLDVRLLDGTISVRSKKATLVLALWEVGGEIIRMSFTNPVTGTVAYLQGGEPVLDLIRELGLRMMP